MRTTILALTLLLGTAVASLLLPSKADVHLDKINLPQGFSIALYADNVPNARQMALTPGGTLFVGSRQEGKVHALVDRDGDHKADQVFIIDDALEMPTGLAFHNGALYVGAVSRILRYDNIEAHLNDPPEPVVVVADLPTERHHGWKFLGFGPDGKLYVPVGAPCNVCDREEPFASILRMNPDGTGREIYARGVRNSVGFTWHPVTGDLWFTDNGRDNISPDATITDNLPPCELNRAPEAGLHFGFPYIHGGIIQDPEFGEGHSADDYTPPALRLGPHVAPLGPAFYTGDMFPGGYKNQLLIAEHGSWNRQQKIGYRISLVTIHDNEQPVTYTTFADGWLDGDENWGRPVDLEVMSDGSLLVSDDQAGVIYRITYTGG